MIAALLMNKKMLGAVAVIGFLVGCGWYFSELQSQAQEDRARLVLALSRAERAEELAEKIAKNMQALMHASDKAQADYADALERVQAAEHACLYQLLPPGLLDPEN